MLLWFLALGSKHAVLLTLVPTLQAQTMVLLVFESFLCQRDVGRKSPSCQIQLIIKNRKGAGCQLQRSWAAWAAHCGVWVSPSLSSIPGWDEGGR